MSQPDGPKRCHRVGEAEAGEDVDAERAEALATDFVAWKSVLFEKGDAPAAPRKQDRCDAPGRARADDHDVAHDVTR